MRNVPANSDMAILRQYVTASDGAIRALPEDLVLIDITHSNLQQKHLEIRVSKRQPIQEVFHLIHQKTGSLVDDLTLELHWYGNDVQTLPRYHECSPQRLLGYFWRDEYKSARLHCIDRNPHSISARGALEDTSLVNKYVMDDETYAARTGTLRSWKEQQQELDPSFTLKRHATQHQALQAAKQAHQRGLPLPPGFIVQDDGTIAAAPAEETFSYDATSVEHCTVDVRCQVTPGHRRGRVAFVGEIPQHEYWVGIVLDEPVGSNDGTFVKNNVRYFEAPGPKYGVFCRGRNVEVGDFPELDLFEDSDDEL